ncbi:MAG: hypothetical protein AAB263_01865 [Planctomycetota bacterium]
MRSTSDIHVGGAVRVTTFPGVARIDVQHLGALVPEALRDPELDKPRRKIWTAQHNDALLDALTAAAVGNGGSFNSFAEWTTMCGAAYDFADINTKRRARFSGPYRAAITTVFGMERSVGLAARIQATAFIPAKGVDFECRAWRPRALYETEFMALAPAVTVCFGGAQQVFLSGVMDWDEAHRPQNTADVRAQIRSVLQRIIAVFEEAGGSRNDVLRLRPMLPMPAYARVLQEEVAALWPEALRPICTVWAGLPMPAGTCAEIQAYGMIGDQRATVCHEPITAAVGMTARVARARDFAMVLAGPFGALSKSVQETTGHIADFMQSQRLGAQDVCTALVQVRDEETERACISATKDVLDPNCLHVIRVRPEEGLSGDVIHVELTARQCG